MSGDDKWPFFRVVIEQLSQQPRLPEQPAHKWYSEFMKMYREAERYPERRGNIVEEFLAYINTFSPTGRDDEIRQWCPKATRKSASVSADVQERLNVIEAWKGLQKTPLSSAPLRSDNRRTLALKNRQIDELTVKNEHLRAELARKERNFADFAEWFEKHVNETDSEVETIVEDERAANDECAGRNPKRKLSELQDQDIPSEELDNSDWKCNACGKDNPAIYPRCWNCGNDRSNV